MINKVIATVKKYNMFTSGAKIVVAVSGGSDSMALLGALLRIKDEFSLKITVAHVNHGLRGKSADDDEAFVINYCEQNGIEVFTLKADIKSLAAEYGMSFEEAGRKVRYEFFDSLADNALIATAHNANDRTETFLFNFTRGSSLRGLCSIPPVRDNIIRPLIDCSKAEILEFCRLNGIPYVTDATNDDVAYSRNRIRHNVITELEKINPSFVSASDRCIETLREDEDYLSSVADELVFRSKLNGGYDVSVLCSAHPSVLKRALVFICEMDKNLTPELSALNEIIKLLHRGGKTEINGGITVRVRKGLLDFPEKPTHSYEPIELVEGKNVFHRLYVEYSIVNNDETNNLQLVSQNPLEYFFDYDKINGRVFLRSRLQGDKISLKSRGCTKSLKKLFNESSVPPENRNGIIVIADDCGVIAVKGFGVDSHVCVTKDTKNVLRIKFTEMD